MERARDRDRVSGAGLRSEPRSGSAHDPAWRDHGRRRYRRVLPVPVRGLRHPCGRRRTPGQLSLTVSFTGPEFFVNDPAPSGWVGSISFGPVPSPSTLTYFNTGPITAGQLVSFPDGEYFDANGNNGTFTLTASAPGLTSDSKTFMVPAHRAAQPRSGRARPTD